MGDIPFHIVFLHLASTERTADISRAQRSKLLQRDTVYVIDFRTSQSAVFCLDVKHTFIVL